MLSKESKIYVAGHHGLVGSAIWNNLLQRGYTNLVGRTHKELDLTDQVAVKQFFDEERPDAVVLAAAFVGGIMANSLYRADQKAALLRSNLHLSKERTTAHEGGLPSHFAIGIYQRGVCYRQDCRLEDV